MSKKPEWWPKCPSVICISLPIPDIEIYKLAWEKASEEIWQSANSITYLSRISMEAVASELGLSVTSPTIWIDMLEKIKQLKRKSKKGKT